MEYDMLKIENQLCFPLYVCSKEIVRLYKPHLDKIGLTYTQYITMMILWEYKSINVKKLGEFLFLDSGTLTPVLKKLESQGFISRQRSKEDERNLDIILTIKGNDLKKIAKDIPTKIGKCVNLSKQDSKNLYTILHKLMNQFKEN